MSNFVRDNRRWFGLALLTAMIGCNALPNWGPFREVPDRLPGVPTPGEKMAALRKLAKDAGARNAEEKQQVVHDLTKAIREEPDGMIRAEIINTLAHYRAPASDQVLRAALDDPDTDVRLAACKAWAYRGTPEAIALLASAAQKDQDKDVRLAAVRALGKSNSPAAVSALGGLLDDGDPAVRYATIGSLRQVTGQDLGDQVEPWRQYVRGEGPPATKAPSLAERWRNMF